MKKYSGILERVRQIEYKYGISYAKPDGSLYKTLKVLYLLIGIYTLFINAVFMLSCYINMQKENMNVKSIRGIFITVLVLTVLLILGYVLNHFKQYLLGAIASIASIVSCAVVFGKELFDSTGFLGMNNIYYWRHFIPLFLMFVFMICLTVIALRAQIKTNTLYKKVVANLYASYSIENGSENEISEEVWEEFLKNYNPHSYKAQFKKD